jgi:hypothetical protein
MKKQIEYFETYTNLAYTITGFYIIVLHFDLLNNFAFQALGVGSFIFHKYKTEKLFLFDWWAMAFMNCVLAGWHFEMYFDNPFYAQLAWVSLILFHVIYSYAIMGKISVYTEVAMSAAPALVAIYLNRSLLTFAVIIGLFLIAIAIRSFDKDPKQAIFHDSFFHGIWHILTAAFYYQAYYLDI